MARTCDAVVDESRLKTMSLDHGLVQANMYDERKTTLLT